MKSVKQLLCVCLAAVLLTVGLPLWAASVPSESCGCGVTPRIYVDGFGSEIYYNQGTPEQTNVPTVVTDDLARTILLRTLPQLTAAAATRDWDRAADGLGLIFDSLLGHLRCDKEGNSVGPITARPTLDPAQNHTENPNYTFRYDWRLDPLTAAEQLHDFIGEVRAATGHENINLTAVSEGGIVALSYLALYQTESLESLALMISAHGGLTMVGELFNRNLALDAQRVTDYLAQTDDGGLLTALLDVLQQSGLMQPVLSLAVDIISHCKDRLFDNTLLPLLGQMPAIWAFVPPEYYDDARASMFGGKKGYDVLLEKIDRYHDLVGSRSTQLLRDAAASGLKIGVIACYGMAAIPAIPGADYQSDSLIDTARSSGGATVARHYQTLPESNSPYRSPDGIIDAATCALPDQTWFVRGNSHDAGPMMAWRDWLFAADEPVTIRSDPRFPQYFLRTADGVVPMAPGTPPETLRTEDLCGALQNFCGAVLRSVGIAK
ncbi:MAG: hypothetical protein LBJ11_00465 [Oscillospiraceae bacterium]|jgi:hypothetical protein|nr:hypothetical protein [Oscillospiraceae bacterium]